MGHEYCGIVEEVGSAVSEVGQAGAVRRRLVRHVRQHLPQLPVRLPVVVRAPRVHHRAQAPVLRVPLADGTLVPTPGPAGRPGPEPAGDLRRAGHRLVRRRRGQREAGQDRRVVGDGAVGLLGVLSAKQMGAERIIAMSRHEKRQKLAREFGATDIVVERGDEGVAASRT
jgi:threonine dehydrogenase-like Zn-dependent dehydrogenase